MLDDEPAQSRILVVEDDGGVRRFNAALLIRSGYEVDTAENGAAAWDMLQRKRYDLLVTDNEMPKMSGVELIGRVVAADLPLPVIMATGLLPAHAFARLPWLQPAAMLIKPYTSEELLGKVKQTLNARQRTTNKIAPPPAEPTEPPM
jgi:DNA-binding NtrC family response regulator